MERIFAQQIYSAVIRSLVSCRDVDGSSAFGFNKEEIDWLAQTFCREKLGSLEQASVCMLLAYDRDLNRRSIFFKKNL